MRRKVGEKIMKYHLCCNQLNHCWEVIDSKGRVIFSGTLSQAEGHRAIKEGGICISKI